MTNNIKVAMKNEDNQLIAKMVVTTVGAYVGGYMIGRSIANYIKNR